MDKPDPLNDPTIVVNMVGGEPPTEEQQAEINALREEITSEVMKIYNEVKAEMEAEDSP